MRGAAGVALSLAVAFLSGAAALVFETLWFHQAGLAFGNSVWAASLVLAAFMSGLALGGWLAARAGDRFSNPLRAYAWLESATAAVGVALVVALPHLTAVLAPLSAGLADAPLLAAYCRAVCLEQTASSELAAAGFVIGGRPSGWLNILAQATRTISTYSRMLKLNPAGRQSVPSSEPEPVSYYEKMSLLQDQRDDDTN